MMLPRLAALLIGALVGCLGLAPAAGPAATSTTTVADLGRHLAARGVPRAGQARWRTPPKLRSRRRRVRSTSRGSTFRAQAGVTTSSLRA